IIPVDSGARAIDGLNDFLNLVQDLRGPTFKRWRILRTMVNKSAKKTERELVARLKGYEKRLLASKIHKSEVANQSHYAESTVFEFDPKSPVANDYGQLRDEIRAYVE
ncbi:MAG: ParA family protein, partial [Bdellovibrionales bacterium]|nr:ParA family protein [Bdellovibrionales bacterium]